MVLGRVWRFIKRHRGRIVFTGALVAGIYASYSYLKSKLEEFHQQRMAEVFEDARKQTHYESNQRTCNTTVLSLMPTLREAIIKELDCERLTDLLQQKPSNKVHIWSELKIIAFARAVVSIYSTCLLILTLRVRLNVVGGCMYSKSDQEQSVGSDENKIMDKYLGRIQYFMEVGVRRLCDAVRLSSEKEILRYSLRHPLSPAELEHIFHGIRAGIEGVDSESQNTSPFIDYLIPDGEVEDIYQDTGLSPSDHERLEAIVRDTLDILRSEDFHVVLQKTIDCAFATLQQHVMSAFNPDTAQRLRQPVGYKTSEPSIPLARIIPPLSGSIHIICTDTADKYLQHVFGLSCVDDMAQQVYTAFCQPVSQPVAPS